LTLTVRTDSPEQTLDLAADFARSLPEGTVVAISGDLGAGKTLFAQGMARGLGVKDHVTSPTFTLINEYQGRVAFYHMDLYRLDNEEEILDLGLEEYFQSSGITLVEWPERIEDFLPSSCIRIHMEKGWEDPNGEYRMIKFVGENYHFHVLIGELKKNENTGR